MTTIHRRVSGCLAAILAVSLLVVGWSTRSPAAASLATAEQARQARPSFAVTARPIKGETAKASGSLGKRGKRAVLIEQRRGKRWVRVATTSTKASGSFRAGFEAKRSGAIRARAPKKGALKQVVTPQRRLILSPQTGALAVPSTVLTTQQATVTAKFTPARAGRRADLYGKVGGTWTKVATAKQNASGVAVFTLVAAAAGTFQYRATARAAAGAPAVTTAVQRMQIDEFDVEITDDTRVLTAAEQDSISDVDLTTGVVTFTGTATPTLGAGDVISLAPTDGAPSGALRRVESLSTTDGTLLVQTTDADLSDVIASMPESQGTFVMCPQVTVVSDLADGVNLLQDGTEDDQCLPSARRLRQKAIAGVVAVTLPPIELESNLNREYVVNDHVSLNVGVRGKVESSPFVELGVQTDWKGQVAGYRLGAGSDWTTALEFYYGVKVEALPEVAREIPLAQIRRIFVGLIGPVPVWVDASAKVSVKFSIEGGREVKHVISQTGRSVLGVTQTSSTNLAPKVYNSNATVGGSFKEVTDRVAASAALASEVELSLYSARGFFAEKGLKAQAEAEWSSREGTTCSFNAGPYFELGLRDTELLKKLTGKRDSFTTSGSSKVIDIDLCPEGTDLDPASFGGPPQIKTEALMEGTVGVPYLEVLRATDDRSGTWTITSGALPPGLVLQPPGDDRTAAIEGTPEQAGGYAFTVTFRDRLSAVATVDLEIRVAPSSLSDLPWAYHNVPYDFMLPAPGGQAGTWSMTGNPSWLHLDATSGRLHGDPTGTGAQQLTVTFHRQVGGTVQVATTLRVAETMLYNMCATESDGGGRVVVAFGAWASAEAPPLPGKFVINGVDLPWGMGGLPFERIKVFLMESGQEYDVEVWANGHQLSSLENARLNSPNGKPCQTSDMLSEYFPYEREELGW